MLIRPNCKKFLLIQKQIYCTEIKKLKVIDLKISTFHVKIYIYVERSRILLRLPSNSSRNVANNKYKEIIFLYM